MAWAALLLGLLLAHTPAMAQSFDENRYYQQCLRFEAGGDLETARQSCLNALQVKPDFVDARLALARIELALGETSSAEQQLNRIRDATDTAEPLVLLAEVAVRGERYIEADALLQQARTRLSEKPNRDLNGQVSFIEGQLAQHRGRYSEALTAYQRAIDADSLDLEYRLAEARLRFRLGDAVNARDQLQSYVQLSGDDRNPEVRSLLGRVEWALGDRGAATDQLETALALRTSRDTVAQARDLRTLAVIYYAEGDMQSGGLALREAMRRGNLQTFVFSNALLWLLLLLLLVAVHLVGESRIANTSTLEVVEGPQPWSVGQVYGVLVASLLMAALAALVFSLVVYDNVLAILTPLQQTDVRAVFLLVFTVLLVLLTWRRVAINGWDPMDRLLGSGEQTVAGIGLGLLLLVATLAYLAYLPLGGLLGPFYLDLSRLTPLVVAAVVLLPLCELFFRAFVIPPLMRRYDAAIAVMGSAGLYALVLVTPVLLLFAIGVSLAAVYRRRSNGITPLVAQLVFHVGLVLAVAFSPWARSLFLH
jgi:tetratricopeptide (TPR) repeat protein